MPPNDEKWSVWLSKFEKTYERFMSQPAPKDIKPEEVIQLATQLGFQVKAGGKHPIKIVDPTTNKAFVVPVEGGIVHWVYVLRLQKMFKIKREEVQS